MSKIDLHERGKTLENEFFRKEERQQLDALRAKKARERSIADLRAISGLADEKILGHLVDTGVDAETLVALSLVPLVAVAWANGNVDSRERDAVLQAAAEAGIAPESPAAEMLDRMLRQQPPSSLFVAWEAYAADLHDSLPEDDRAGMATEIRQRARDVAEAAGGILGIGSISKAEQAVLDRIDNVFAD